MDRKEAISIIENLYPADSQYSDSREIGKQLLEQAEREVNNWRHKPTEVLVRYAELCMEKDNKSTAELIKRSKVW